MPKFAPRIHVLFASRAPVGLVIRRGPSKAVATFLWDRKSDQIRIGQWLKGRIYERRSDISPDGKYVIYFAMNGKWESESRGAWTAISLTPYLKAIALFTKGDCWHGGGLWTSKNSYWLNDGYGHDVFCDTISVHRDLNYQPAVNSGGECLGVYYQRLLRDGWVLMQRREIEKWKDIDVFEKKIGKGWILRKIAHSELGAPVGKGCYWDEHELVGPDGRVANAFPDWEWADLDNKRLAWASTGRIFTAKVCKDGLSDQTQLYDFNDIKFEALQAPY